MGTYHEACEKLGLVGDDDDEWHKTMKVAATWASSKE